MLQSALPLMEPQVGFEPTNSAWKAEMLPLHHWGWCAVRDSNPRHPGCRPGALATELTTLVELLGFEPRSSYLQGRRHPN